MLTIVIPTRNRPQHCRTLINFFRSCELHVPIVFADSSNENHVLVLDAERDAGVEVKRFDEDCDFVDKVITTIDQVKSDYIALLPDDDVTFPHAIESCLAFLERNPDFAVAHGYTLDFGVEGKTYDIKAVRWFTPTIQEDEPLERLHHLLSRYQPFFWSVYRRPALRQAFVAAAAAPRLTILRELTILATVVLHGKVARLQNIFTLRGMEESQTPLSDINPFHALLRDAPGLISMYGQYRQRLVDMVRQLQLSGQSRVGADRPQIDHLVDLMHATLMAPEMDRGMLMHTVQRLLGAPLPAISFPPAWTGIKPLEIGDLVNSGNQGSTFIWRRAVLEAEPRGEIHLQPTEFEAVERQLSDYLLH